ncbi:uncharacterized protein LAJ45_01640 [Morchella importuna]|uniref:uncharacterized protein n=1 Tax=Morchella importuna TaxID=1174673 RepID=UPI001E8D47E4|nr:uncharacterized protein LAJ45_10728 [Morchella importuna]XP_045975177.1 uncharacterized protein LAJ45_01640 [Morchella importuna]KAH8145291.1 hypothetical protein LAJ45_10728 [Morchella importuna]KAH8153873.1 hypothetical protein LAJ45_01640 [Morchella importuna]
MARKGTKKKLDDEERVLAAVKAYRSGKFKNIRDAAMAHDITYGKLRNRLAGVQSKTHSHIDQQALTPAEEKAIVAWIVQLDIWGFPPRMKYVKDLATNYVRSHGVKNPNLGVNWTTRFLTRHPELESKFAIRLDKQRGFANNPKVIKDFFKKVKL